MTSRLRRLALSLVGAAVLVGLYTWIAPATYRACAQFLAAVSPDDHDAAMRDAVEAAADSRVALAVGKIGDRLMIVEGRADDPTVAASAVNRVARTYVDAVVQRERSRDAVERLALAEERSTQTQDRLTLETQRIALGARVAGLAGTSRRAARTTRQLADARRRRATLEVPYRQLTERGDPLNVPMIARDPGVRQLVGDLARLDNARQTLRAQPEGISRHVEAVDAAMTVATRQLRHYAEQLALGVRRDYEEVVALEAALAHDAAIQHAAAAERDALVARAAALGERIRVLKEREDSLAAAEQALGPISASQIVALAPEQARPDRAAVRVVEGLVAVAIFLMTSTVFSAAVDRRRRWQRRIDRAMLVYRRPPVIQTKTDTHPMSPRTRAA